MPANAMAVALLAGSSTPCPTCAQTPRDERNAAAELAVAPPAAGPDPAAAPCPPLPPLAPPAPALGCPAFALPPAGSLVVPPLDCPAPPPGESIPAIPPAPCAFPALLLEQPATSA